MSVQVATEVWQKSRHSGANLLMLLAIADFADNHGRAYPAVSTLAQKCRVKPRAANYALAELRESGELQVQVGKGPKGTNLYQIDLARLNEKAIAPQPTAPMQELAALQPTAPLQEFAPMQPTAALQQVAPLQLHAQGAAISCAPPLQPVADKPSMNHQGTVKEEKSAHPRYEVVIPEWMPPAEWINFLDLRRRMRGVPFTDAARQLVVGKLTQLREKGYDPAALLNEAVQNGWRTVFEPRGMTGRAPAAGSKHAGFAEKNYRDGVESDGSFV